MMVFRRLFFIVFLSILSACSSVHSENDDYSSSRQLTYHLLSICLDKTLNTYSEYNTGDYVLDLSRISTFNKDGIDSFIVDNQNVLPILSDDSSSVLKSIDETGSKPLENMIVRFEDVDFIDKKHVYITISKVRSRNQIITLGLDLKRHGDTYKIFKSETKR